MSELVVQTDRLNKRFRVVGAKCSALGNIKRIITAHKNRTSYYNALSDVSIKVRRGQRVALIGNNGAGKTTLLRIIAGIFSPSSGSVKIFSPPSVLLKLGTGVIQDLSINENINLISAIFGFYPKDPGQFQHEVLEFAELQDLAELAIKDLSSGQSQRIVLSIFIKTCKDFVVFDESFAFVDQSFAHKCEKQLSKMYSDTNTFIYCAHDMEFLRRNCTDAIWLEHGKVKMVGEITSVLDQYRSTT